MKRQITLALIAVIAVIGVLSVPLTQSAQAEGLVPDWIKTNAGWWSEDIISNDEFTTSIEYLITNGIIVIPESEEGYTSSELDSEIPPWIKSTASWWSQEAITDTEFVNALQYLIKEGIINVQ